MLDRSNHIADVISRVNGLKKRIENARSENDELRTKTQESLQAKGGSELTAAVESCTKAAINLAVLQEQLAVAEKKVAVKDDILLGLKVRKLEWANEKMNDRKTLLNVLGIGLNVAEVGPETAKIEFIVDSRRITTNYHCAEEKFQLLSIEPAINNAAFEDMQRLLSETNDICGLLSAAKKRHL